MLFNTIHLASKRATETQVSYPQRQLHNFEWCLPTTGHKIMASGCEQMSSQGNHIMPFKINATQNTCVGHFVSKSFFSMNTIL